MRLVASQRTRALRLLIVAVAILATVPVFATAPPASAQGTATIEITNIDAGTGLPAPFTRFQVTSENGTVYGPMETDLNGYVAFAVTVDPQGTSFTVIEETPSACAVAPEPQSTGPVLAGEWVSLTFTTQDNPGCGLGTIALYAMACPEGFTGPADDYGPWRDACTGTNDGTVLTVTSVATGQTWNPIAGGYGIPGRAPVVGLPVGDYTIQQGGETPAAVFCLIYDTNNYATSPEPSSVVPVSLSGGIGTVSLTGNRVTCDMFTVPGGAPEVLPTAEVIEPAAGATLDVHLAECPAGYVPTESIYDDCHGNGLTGIPVQLSSSNGFAATTSTMLAEDLGVGTARFTDLGEGTYVIGASLPDNVTFLTYCSDQEFVEIPSSFDEVNRTLTLDLFPGQVVTCDWFVIPSGVEPAEGTSFLEMHALQCPAGTDPSGALYDLCHGDGAAGITYTVTGPDGYAGQATTTIPVSPGPGIATFGQLSDGQYTITQQGISPLDALVVYCSLDDDDIVVPTTVVDTGVVVLDLPADTGVVCDWYTVPPSAASTTLQVTNYLCSYALVADETTPLTAFQEACTPNSGTTQFTLTPDGADPVTRTTGTAGVGAVLFEALPSNSYRLTSSIPGHDVTSYAFCGLENGTLQLSGVQEAAFWIDAAAGPYLCQWFNVPVNSSGISDTLTVTNYLCPPGTTGNYASRCSATPLAGATYELARGGWKELNGVTAANGLVAFEQLVPGSYRLTNLPPSGVHVSVYVVACEAGGQSFEFTYNDRQSMSIELDLPGNVDVDCAWYSIPPGTPDVTPGQKTGSIVVHAFLCQGKSIAQYRWETDCTVETAPVGFSLATEAGSPIAVGTTNSEGILTFTNLADGAYRLDETSGNWCHAEADLVDSAGNLLIRNAGENHVYIYNCSLQNVQNLPSTGTGQTNPVVRASFGEDNLWQLLFAAIATLGIALVVRYGLHQAVAQSAGVADESATPVRSEDPIP